VSGEGRLPRAADAHDHGAEDTPGDATADADTTSPLIVAGRRPLPEALFAYAEAGLAIFPLPPGRKHWTGRDALDYRHATTDRAELHRLTAGVNLADPQAWPNIAMQPGRSGLIAVDLDGKAGMESWVKAATDAGADPWATLGYPTPREDGGVRLLYRAPAELRFGKRVPLDGVEVFGHVGHVVLPPSIHPNGKPYAWATERAMAELPPFGVAMLGRVGDGPDEATDSATTDEVEQFLASLPNAKAPSLYAARALDNLLANLRRATPGSRHQTCVHAVARALELAVDGGLDAGPALDQLCAAFAEVLASERDRLPAAEFAGILRWSVAKVRRARDTSRHAAASGTAFTALVAKAGQVYIDLDPDAVAFVLAISATGALIDGSPPVWGALVGASSGGKTALLELVRDVPQTLLTDEVSTPGLLSWTRGKIPKPTGLLVRLGALGTLLVQDFSTLLTEDGYREREKVFAALRRVHDGHYGRSLGERDGVLDWDGRLTLLTAVTHAVDSYAAHMAALGARWVYLRLSSREVDGKKAMSRMSRSRSNTSETMRELRRQAADLVAVARGRLPDVDVPAQLGDLIDDVAVVCCYGRGNVPRSGYGRREVTGLPDVEEPARAAQGLALLARGALALGLDAEDVGRLVLRCGVDSMPRARAVVLGQLSDGEVLTAAEIARRTGIARTVTREVLDDLRLLGLAETDGDEEHAERDRTPLPYSLGGEAGDIAQAVLKRYRDATFGRV
jgi:hypothetical protein